MEKHLFPYLSKLSSGCPRIPLTPPPFVVGSVLDSPPRSPRMSRRPPPEGAGAGAGVDSPRRSAEAGAGAGAAGAA